MTHHHDPHADLRSTAEALKKPIKHTWRPLSDFSKMPPQTPRDDVLSEMESETRKRAYQRGRSELLNDELTKREMHYSSTEMEALRRVYNIEVDATWTHPDYATEVLR